MTDTNPSSGGAAEKVDIFRDTPIRFLGYCNEVGESFRALVSVRLVYLSYFVSSTYCLADAAHKAIEVKHTAEAEVTKGRKGPNRQAIEEFIECCVWQGLASVIIPGFTINRLCYFSGMFLRKYASPYLIPNTQKLLVTSIGLGSVPLIIKPIDHISDIIVDEALSIGRRYGF